MPYLICIIESLILNSQPTALKLMPELSPYNTHFLNKAYHTGFFKKFRNTTQHFRTTFGGHFKQQNHPKKELNRPQKAKQEGRASPCSALGGNMHIGYFTFFCLSAHVHIMNA